MVTQRSRKSVRQDAILAALERNPALRVFQLAEELGGLCRKPHGNIDWGMRALPFQGVRRCSVADISIDQ